MFPVKYVAHRNNLTLYDKINCVFIAVNKKVILISSKHIVISSVSNFPSKEITGLPYIGDREHTGRQRVASTNY